MNKNFEPEEYGRIISALVVDMGTALKEKTITLDEAEECLFHQDLVDVLEFAGIPKEVVGLIHVGTELKDIETLVAGHVDEMVGKVMTLAHEQMKCLPKTMDPSDKWFRAKHKPVRRKSKGRR